MSLVVILMQRPYYAEFLSFPNLKTFYFVDVKCLKEGGGCLRRDILLLDLPDLSVLPLTAHLFGPQFLYIQNKRGLV